MVHAFGRFEVERFSLAAALALAVAGVCEAQDLAETPREDWPTYGGGFSQQRFSLLRQVTTKNVGRLRVQWTFPIPDAGTGNTSLEPTPLVVRGSDAGMPALDAVMLITSPKGRVLALDAARGRRLWEFAPSLRTPLSLCCSRSNRGAAFGRVDRAPGAVEPRVYVSTPDARLWALSAASGQPVASFGDGADPAGSVTVADNALGYSLTMAPLFIPRGDIPPEGATRGRDVVVVGISGGEFEARGFVTAYDALTGERLWRFFTVPGPGEFGGDTWPAGLAAPFADPAASSSMAKARRSEEPSWRSTPRPAPSSSVTGRAAGSTPSYHLPGQREAARDGGGGRGPSVPQPHRQPAHHVRPRRRAVSDRVRWTARSERTLRSLLYRSAPHLPLGD